MVVAALDCNKNSLVRGFLSTQYVCVCLVKDGEKRRLGLTSFMPYRTQGTVSHLTTGYKATEPFTFLLFQLSISAMGDGSG